jgi:hypothetical protein
MGLIEVTVMSGSIGTVVECWKRGVIHRQGEVEGLPATIKVLMIGILFGLPAVTTGTLAHYLETTLSTIGAFTAARWCMASLIVAWRWRGTSIDTGLGPPPGRPMSD